MLRFPPVRSRVGLGEHPSDCLRGSKRAHKAHNKKKTNRDFIRDHLSCRSTSSVTPPPRLRLYTPTQLALAPGPPFLFLVPSKAAELNPDGYQCRLAFRFYKLYILQM
ncbi:hypothetical protein VNO78_39896 [Psophocarpus tetragonolobus]|uniref:Uncharacterized protein n=1 Tax=Psophocarpus tetragonolobus TaxID=3891 RepID=A0AAN9N2A7_PSOTE